MPPFQTQLSPDEENSFLQWIKQNNIQDLNEPDSYYDYRGFWKANPDFQHQPGQHFTDQFKQPGHPTFSNESQYATPEYYGGRWSGDTYIPQLSTSRQSLNPDQLGNSVRYLAEGNLPQQMNAAAGPKDPSQMLQDLIQQRMLIQQFHHKQAAHDQKMRHAEEKHQSSMQSAVPNIPGMAMHQPPNPNMPNQLGQQVANQMQQIRHFPPPPAMPAPTVQPQQINPMVLRMLLGGR